MKVLKCLAGLAAALLLCGALAEPTETEYLVDMTPNEINLLERRLSELGYLGGEANEAYDANTRMAIESFQQANGLEVSGAPDDTTLERLYGDAALSRQDYLRRFANAYAQMAPLEKGNANNDVLMMQNRLKEYGFFSGKADGVFGDATQMAVESFQMVNGLMVTGVADGATIMRLMADTPITWPGFLSEMNATAGDTGLNVYVLQKKLGQMGYYEGECSGSFGDLTQRALLRFQAENGLEETGVADGPTWAVIYSGAAVAPQREDVLQIGDYGERVLQLQQRLNALGFYDYDIAGRFDYATETAVRLFQMACGMTPTGEADVDTVERLMGEAPASLMDMDVQQRFDAMLDAADEDAQASLAEVANRMLGASFGTPDDDLYPGFSFVQYVCACAGLPVAMPEDLIRMADEPVEDAAAVRAGDIVAFQNAGSDSVTILLTIGAGEGKIIHTTASGGWVVLGFMDQMESSSVYRWDAKGFAP